MTLMRSLAAAMRVGMALVKVMAVVTAICYVSICLRLFFSHPVASLYFPLPVGLLRHVVVFRPGPATVLVVCTEEATQCP